MTTLAAISDQSEIRDPWAVLLIALVGLVVYAILCAHQRATERASRRARDRARHPATRNADLARHIDTHANREVTR